MTLANERESVLCGDLTQHVPRLMAEPVNHAERGDAISARDDYLLTIGVTAWENLHLPRPTEAVCAASAAHAFDQRV
jgi:hypothetical protein